MTEAGHEALSSQPKADSGGYRECAHTCDGNLPARVRFRSAASPSLPLTVLRLTAIGSCGGGARFGIGSDGRAALDTREKIP